MQYQTHIFLNNYINNLIVQKSIYTLKGWNENTRENKIPLSHTIIGLSFIQKRLCVDFFVKISKVLTAN